MKVKISKIKQIAILVVSLGLFFSCSEKRKLEGKITFVFSSNVRAQLDPCGWKKNPLGGLSRKLTYVNQIKEKGIDPIILDAGEALFPSPFVLDNTRSADEYKAKSFIKGFQDIGCDAINIGKYDLAGGHKFLKNIIDSTSIPFISANLRIKETGKLFSKPYVLIDRDPFRVGVIGLTNLIEEKNNYFTIDDMYETGNKYIEEVRKIADLIILLVNADRKEKKVIQDKFVNADYIIMSHDITRTRKGQQQPKDKPPVFNPGKQGKYLGILELEISDLDSKFVDIGYFEKIIETSKRRLENYQKKDPNTPLKKLYSDNQSVYRQIVNIEQQLNEAQSTLNKSVNKTKFDLIGMSRKIKDDSRMLDFVDQCLAKEKIMRGDTSVYPKHKHGHNHNHNHKW